MSEQIRIRNLTIKDYDDLLILQNHPDNICPFQDNIKDYLENPDYFYGIFINDKLIGCCSIGGADGAIENANYNDRLLSDVFILPEYRNKKYGQVFISLVCAKDNTKVFAVPFPGTEKFYEKAGFEYTGTEGLMYYTPYEGE